MRPFRGTRVEGGLRRSCPQQASLSACPMPTRSASQADDDKCNEKNISFSAFIPQLSQGDFPPSKLKFKFIRLVMTICKTNYKRLCYFYS
ncbi:MAG: hypothetical protein QXG85_05375 [Thermoproteota archaeon]